MNIDATTDSAEALEAAVGRYNDTWNAHDLDAIMAMHAPDMVFENHTAGESAVGEEARVHIGSIFETGPTSPSRPGASTCARGWSCRNGPPGDPRQHDAPRRSGRQVGLLD